MFQPHRILHPTDFSACSTYAYRVALDLAEQNQALLLLLHVVETLGPENVTYGEAVSQMQPEGYDRRLHDELRRLAPPADAAVAVEYLLVEGDPGRQIVAVARDRHCDLIVMGTHGRTGLARLLMGSIAEKIVRQAPCPVLISKIHLPEPAAAAS